MEGGKRIAGSSKQGKPDMSQFSKWIVADIRPLLWFVTVGGFALAFYCVRVGYTGALPGSAAWLGCRGLPMAWYAAST